MKVREQSEESPIVGRQVSDNTSIEACCRFPDTRKSEAVCQCGNPDIYLFIYFPGVPIKVPSPQIPQAILR